VLIVQDRTQRVKDARTEAAKEIEAYKLQKEKDFKQFETEVLPLAFPCIPCLGVNDNSILGQTRKQNKQHKKKLRINSKKSIPLLRNHEQGWQMS
jgi:hypothetical protein